MAFDCFFYLKTSKLYYIFTSRVIYDPNALARDHVNSFWDTSTPICQTENLAGIYTGSKMYQYLCYCVQFFKISIEEVNHIIVITHYYNITVTNNCIVFFNNIFRMHLFCDYLMEDSILALTTDVIIGWTLGSSRRTTSPRSEKV